MKKSMIMSIALQLGLGGLTVNDSHQYPPVRGSSRKSISKNEREIRKNKKKTAKASKRKNR